VSDTDGVRHPPLLLLVTGMPASGKTTLARQLGAELGLPVMEKDAVKEELFDTLGVGDVEWSQRLGGATYPLIVLFARRLLEAGQSVVLEANFFRGSESLFADLPPHRLVQVHCVAPLEMLIERYTARSGTRHPGHHDEQRVDELRTRHASGANGPLDIDGELIEADTAGPIDLRALVDRLRM
jgi:predicted kinase